MPRGALLRPTLYYGAQAILMALVLVVLPGIHDFPLKVPIIYNGDGLFFTALLRAVREDGFFHVTRIGAPFGSDIVDWPVGMWLPWGVMAALMAVFDEPGTAINLYWFSTILACGLGASWAFRRLRIGPALAFVLGTLYAFQPYGFYRNVGHINLAFPLVPLLALLCLRVAGTHPEAETRGERALTLAACAAQGFCYVYYSFFACVLLAVAAPIGWLRTGSWRLVRRAAVAILLIAVGTAVTMLPSVLYWQKNGPNRELAYKIAEETDVFGLKIRHMLVPISDHPLPPLRAFAATVERAFPSDNENGRSKLASLGSLGFLALLGLLIGRAAGLRPPRDEDLDGAAALTLVTLLIALVGGFASFFSVLVSPEIRAYNRIVVFISFFSLLALGTLLTRGRARWPRLVALPRRTWLLLLAALLLVGLLDEIPAHYLAGVRQGSDLAFAEDRAFTRAIEAQLPAGAMVFQIPSMTIPVEHNSRPPMAVYDPGRAYVHSKKLRWSCGAILGRTGDWQSGVSALPPRDMIQALALADFSGIWLDRYGYTGRFGPRHEIVELELVALAGQPLLVSSSGRYSFVLIERYRQRLEHELGPELLETRRREILAQTPILRWREGCSGDRKSAGGWWRSCGASAWFVLRNSWTDELEVTLTGRFRAADATGGSVRVSAPGFEDEVPLGREPFAYRRVVVLKGGQRLKVTLKARSGAPCPAGPDGPRCFQLGELRAASRRLPRAPSSTADEAAPAP